MTIDLSHFEDPDQQAQFYDSLHAETMQQESMRQQATQQQASDAAAIYAKYPHLDPSVVASLAAAGADEQTVQQAADLTIQNKVKPKSGGLGFHTLGDIVHGVGTVAAKAIDFAVPEAVRSDIGTVARGTLRAATTAAAFPLQYAEGNSRVLYSDITNRDLPNLAKDVLSGGTGGFQANRIIAQTTAGQALNQATGNVGFGANAQHSFTPGNVDLGSGFFGSGTAATQQAAASRAEASINGHAFTPGRFAANLASYVPNPAHQFGLGGKELIEPGSTPFNVLSGLLDAAYTWEADPVAAYSRGRAAGERAAEAFANASSDEAVARAAAKASPEYAQQVRNAVGLVQGDTRNTILPNAVQEFMYSKDGQRVAQNLADEDSPVKIWRGLGLDRVKSRVIPASLVTDLAAAKTPEEVLTTLAPHLGQGIDRPEVGRFSQEIGPLGMRFRQTLEQHFRAFNVVPDAWMSLDNPEQSMKNLYTSLANAKVLGPQRDELMNKAFAAYASGGKENFFDVVNAAKDAQVASIRNYLGAGKWEAKVADETLSASQRADASMKLAGIDERANSMVDPWQHAMDRINGYTVDDQGVAAQFPLVPDGTDVKAVAKPTAIYQLANSTIPLYDPGKMQEIRDTTTKLHDLEQAMGLKQAKIAANFLQQDIWKPLNSLRPAVAVRVLGQQFAQVMSSGRFDNSFDYFPYLAHRAASDLTGVDWDIGKQVASLTDELAAGTTEARAAEIHAKLDDIQNVVEDGKTDYQRAMNSKITEISGDRDYRREMVRQQNKVRSYPVVDKAMNPEQWKQGVADQLLAQSTDPVYSRVASGDLRNGDRIGDYIHGESDPADHNVLPGLDGIKKWLTDGTGQKYVEQMQAIYPRMTREALASDMVDSAVAHIEQGTGGNADLRNIIATGHFFPTTIGGAGETAASVEEQGIQAGTRVLGDNRRIPTSALQDRIAEFINDPNSPQKVIYQQSLQRASQNGDTTASRFLGMRDDARGWVWQNLYGKATDYLMRGPLFKADYSERMVNAFPFMTAEARQSALDAAVEHDYSPGIVNRMKQSMGLPEGSHDLATADSMAKGHALDALGDYLWNADNHSQFFDIAKVIFPYGEAWKEFLSKATNIVSENPGVIRRAQVLVQGGRGLDPTGSGQGFFHSDPTTHQEMFSYPLTGRLAQILTAATGGGPGINVPFSGSVQGLSLGLNAIPGVGPVTSIALAKLKPDIPQADFLGQLFFPHGEPEGGKGALTQAILPSWASKMIEGIRADPNTDRIYANTLLETMDALAASGQYGSSPDEVQRLQHDARDKARVLTIFRGMLQSTLPSAPTPEYMAKTKQGDVATALLFQDFTKMQQDDYSTAVPNFIDKYGDNAFLYMVHKTQSNIGGLGASTEFGDFERNNPDLFAKYKDIAGFFGPETGTFDSAVYNRQLRTGDRTRKTSDQVLQEGQSLVARMIYDQAKTRVGPTPDANSRQWLQQIRDALTQTYPLYNPDSFGSGKNPQQIRDLQRAIAEDPTAKNSDVGQALSLYFQARDKAVDAAKEQGITSGNFQQTTGAAGIRDWLRQVGAAIAQQTPAFQRVFDEVLDREMKNDQPAPAVAA